ncbi:MAG: hypothetical protein JWO03_1455 [Bacteroidetes bacterium]|nr:hypothetical protein [Bacteroidota bacterium]
MYICDKLLIMKNFIFILTRFLFLIGVACVRYHHLAEMDSPLVDLFLVGVPAIFCIPLQIAIYAKCWSSKRTLLQALIMLVDIAMVVYLFIWHNPIVLNVTFFAIFTAMGLLIDDDAE